MKQITHILILLLLGMALMPAAAQHAKRGGPDGPGNPPPPPSMHGGQEQGGKRPRGPEFVSGKVRIVDAKAGTATIAFVIHVNDPKTPGKMPDDMALLAASLADQADQLNTQAKALEARANEYDQQGNADKAAQARKERQERVKREEQLRRQIEECQRWRETLGTASAETPLTSVKRVAFTALTNGTTIRLQGYVKGVAKDGTMPTAVTIVKDAMVLQRDSELRCRQLPAVGAEKTFFFIIGKVTSTDPLTLDVGDGAKVQVNNPENRQCLQMAPMQVRELKQGQSVLARLRQTPTGEITSIERMLLVPSDGPRPFDMKEMFPF